MSGWPFPGRFPGGGPWDQRNQKEPDGSKTFPHQYSWTDKLYIWIVKYRMGAYTRDPPPREVIDRLRRGDREGIPRSDINLYIAQYRDPWVKGQSVELRDDLAAYEKGDPLRHPELKRAVLKRTAVLDGVQVGGVLAAFYGGRRLTRAIMGRTNRAPQAQTQSQTQLQALEVANVAGGSARLQAVPAKEFYQNSHVGEGERVSQLIQRERDLRNALQQ